MYDWKKAKGMRDIINHHYFETDAEVIYDVCKNHIPEYAYPLDSEAHNMLYVTVSTLEPIPSSV